MDAASELFEQVPSWRTVDGPIYGDNVLSSPARAVLLPAAITDHSDVKEIWPIGLVNMNDVRQ